MNPRVLPRDIVAKPNGIPTLIQRYRELVRSLRSLIKFPNDGVAGMGLCDCCGSVSMVNTAQLIMGKPSLLATGTTVKLCLFCVSAGNSHTQITPQQYEQHRYAVGMARRDIIDVFAAEAYRRPSTIEVIDRMDQSGCVICKKLYVMWRHNCTYTRTDSPISEFTVIHNLCHTCVTSIEMAARALSQKHAAYMVLVPRDITHPDVSMAIIANIVSMWD